MVRRCTGPLCRSAGVSVVVMASILTPRRVTSTEITLYFRVRVVPVPTPGSATHEGKALVTAGEPGAGATSPSTAFPRPGARPASGSDRPVSPGGTGNLVDTASGWYQPARERPSAPIGRR